MLNKIFLASVLLLCFELNCSAQNIVRADTSVYNNLIGTNSESLANSLDFRFKSFGLIGKEFSKETQFGIKVFKVNQEYLVVFLETDPISEKTWIIKDQILLGNIVDGYSIATQMCKRNNKKESGIFAVAKNSNETYQTEIKQAWKINFSRKRIDRIETDGIKCESMFSTK